jgi:hypothetical protein
MMFAIVGVLASLALILALNWERFNSLGSETVTKMLVTWTGIIVALVLVAKLFGY